MLAEKERSTEQDEALSPLALNLRRLRTDRGWSQGEFADKIGAHITHVSRVETGKYNPGLEFVINAARAFGITVDDLVSERNDGFQEVKLENKELTERVRMLEALDERDREALLTVMDAVLTKQRMKRFLEGEVASARVGT
jgi:transcriptional regulator with XRE-family HTH domain